MNLKQFKTRARGSIAGLTTQQGRPKGGLHVRERSPDVYGWLLKIAPTVTLGLLGEMMTVQVLA